MSELVLSANFWAALVVVFVYQFSNFSQLSKTELESSPELRHLMQLRAEDFIDRTDYRIALAFYLAVSFIVFSLACSLPPAIVIGLIKASGLKPDTNFTWEPSFVAALYLGTSSVNIPIVSQLSDFQRRMFHSWLGIPTVVSRYAEALANEVVASQRNVDEPKRLLNELTTSTDPIWISGNNGLISTSFFRAQIEEMKVEWGGSLNFSELSYFERERLYRRIVLYLTIAAVQEKGGVALVTLAKKFDFKFQVWNPLRLDPKLGIACALCVFSSVILWLGLLLASDFVFYLNKSLDVVHTFLPNCSHWSARHPPIVLLTDETELAGRHEWSVPTPCSEVGFRLIADHVWPIFLALGIFLLKTRSVLEGVTLSQLERTRWILSTLAAVFAIVVGYLLVRELSDWSTRPDTSDSFVGNPEITLGHFFLNRVPVATLQALVACGICFCLLTLSRVNRVADIAKSIAVVSFCCFWAGVLYAVAVLLLQYKGDINHPSFIIIVASLNASAAGVAVAVGRWAMFPYPSELEPFDNLQDEVISSKQQHTGGATEEVMGQASGIADDANCALGETLPPRGEKPTGQKQRRGRVA